jgi:hypothetical protein
MCLTSLSTIFMYILAVSFVGGGNSSWWSVLFVDGHLESRMEQNQGIPKTNIMIYNIENFHVIPV